jgi:hypothetical protein
MITELTLEKIAEVKARAESLPLDQKQRYLAGFRDGIDLVTEPLMEGTLAGGSEIQNFYDYLDTQAAPVLPPSKELPAQ